MTATVLLAWAYLVLGFVIAATLILILFTVVDAHKRGMDRVRKGGSTPPSSPVEGRVPRQRASGPGENTRPWWQP